MSGLFDHIGGHDGRTPDTGGGARAAAARLAAVATAPAFWAVEAVTVAAGRPGWGRTQGRPGFRPGDGFEGFADVCDVGGRAEASSPHGDDATVAAVTAAEVSAVMALAAALEAAYPAWVAAFPPLPVWARLNSGPAGPDVQALRGAPTSATKKGYTDWSGVRPTVKGWLEANPCPHPAGLKWGY